MVRSSGKRVVYVVDHIIMDTSPNPNNAVRYIMNHIAVHIRSASKSATGSPSSGSVHCIIANVLVCTVAAEQYTAIPCRWIMRPAMKIAV